MNIVDATDRTEKQDEAEAPSLLAIILDTDPHAWNLLADSLPLSKTVANLLVFINAHLAINHANRVAVIASHSERAEWLYPTPATTHKPAGETNGTHPHDGDEEMRGAVNLDVPAQPADDANKYRPFAHIEHALLTNLRRLMSTTTPESLSSTPSTMIAGALTLALSYISKQTLASTTTSARSAGHFNYSDPTSVAGGNEVANSLSGINPALTLSSRVLILSVSGDLASQYIPLMNSIFACQRLTIPIDILKLAGSTAFLQQAADATGGIYTPLTSPTAHAGLLQYLMFAYLPDAAAREHLIMPGEGEGVDFRAACFCHRKIVDVGYVCSVCLSIFCEVLQDGVCLTCGSHLRLSGFGRRPAVVPKKKKKKKRLGDGTGTATPEGTGTPAPG